ncbi:hypothetical protein ACFY05_32955 [Microtetraspora fusca]|uniref:Uncharacterized protein n=1 Tax=Microtetraspora fusca TaxID=1997 RepID=A0ABW6VE53_MICFU
MTNMAAWYVVNMDDGVIRAEPTKENALRWVANHWGVGAVQPGQHRLHDGFYEYYVGTSASDRRQVWIVLGVVLALHGWDINETPLYPHPDRPAERVDRQMA